MILLFVDHEGDPCAVESSAIVGLSVGTVNGPRNSRKDPLTVTLIWAAGAAQPFMVAAPFAQVLAAWEAARTAGPPADLKGAHGWPVNWDHPSLRLPGAAPWAAAAKRGGES